jgi:glycosyltransferase involved in cell wall biosynthesis
MISDTLESVFAQEYDDYEVIVVDDGSTDSTVEVVKSYGDRVTLLQQENRGPGAARNTGVQEAKGTYVAFLDSDDRWFPWTLRVYRDAVEKGANPSFISGSLYPFTSGAELPNSRNGVLRHQNYKDYLEAARQGLYVGTGMACIKRKKLVKIGGFTTKDINSEDHDLALRLGTAPRFVVIDKPPTVAQRLHDNKLMKDLEKTFSGLCHLIEKEKEGSYPGGKKRSGDRRYIICQHARSGSMRLCNKNMTKKALNIYIKTFVWNMVQFRCKYLLGFPVYALREQFSY